MRHTSMAFLAVQKQTKKKCYTNIDNTKVRLNTKFYRWYNLKKYRTFLNYTFPEENLVINILQKKNPLNNILLANI